MSCGRLSFVDLSYLMSCGRLSFLLEKSMPIIGEEKSREQRKQQDVRSTETGETFRSLERTFRYHSMGLRKDGHSRDVAKIEKLGQ